MDKVINENSKELYNMYKNDLISLEEIKGLLEISIKDEEYIVSASIRDVINNIKELTHNK